MPNFYRPTTDNRKAWNTYWKSYDQPWRIEPEISKERQFELAKCRDIKPDIEKGIYPFKEIKLSRADVEWLLATHDGERGPVNWNDAQDKEREGLDLRSADLCQVDLSGLPLAKLRGGLTTEEQRSNAAVLLNGANLSGAQLQGAILAMARLRKAKLVRAKLQNADLSGVQLQGANLFSAELQNADLCMNAQLQDAELWCAQLQNAKLWGVSLQGAHLASAQLQDADLYEAQLQGAILANAQLQNANLNSAELQNAILNGARLDGASLDKITLGDQQHIGPQLVDVQWGDAILSVVDWSQMTIIGDEHMARQKKSSDGERKTKDHRLEDYRSAVRANRQLAVALQAQGLNEDASRFAYRAHLCQRKVLWYQGWRSWAKWLGSWFLALLAGYGYQPMLTILWYLMVIASFAIAYSFNGPLPFWPDSLVFSVMSFHGRGFFPSLSGETSLHNPVVMLAAAEAIVGLLIEVSFIATFTQRFFGK